VLKGAATGLIGVAVKPVVGVADLITRTTQGVMNTTHLFEAQRQRIREPRHFGADGLVPCYSEAKAMAQSLIWSLMDSNADSAYITHVPVSARCILLVSTKRCVCVCLVVVDVVECESKE
jgi:vacuolar protein sorting-associated protein 13A/C